MDPVFGPILLCLLVVYYLTHRFGHDLRTLGQWAAAHAADAVAAGAGKVGASRVADKAVATATRLRDRPKPSTPRTAAGQTLLAQLRAAGRKVRNGLSSAVGRDTAGGTTRVPGGGATVGEAAAGATGLGVGRLVSWLRLVWVDAVAAAHSAQQRRNDTTYPPREHWWSRPAWMSWPTGDDPQAPVHAEATRLDRDPATTPGALATPTAPELPAGGAKPAAPDVIDAELVDESPLVTPVAAITGITDGRNTTMETTVAESGLEAYLQHARHMATECEAARHSTEATVAALTGQDWSGVPIDAYQAAAEALSTATLQFTTAVSAFEAALAVKESYGANPHAGTKESVTS